jgi:hypothetical protein
MVTRAALRALVALAGAAIAVIPASAVASGVARHCPNLLMNYGPSGAKLRSWDARGVTVRGVTCAAAAPTIRSAAPNHLGPLVPRYIYNGFSCSGNTRREYTCKSGSKTIAFHVVAVSG